MSSPSYSWRRWVEKTRSTAEAAEKKEARAARSDHLRISTAGSSAASFHTGWLRASFQIDLSASIKDLNAALRSLHLSLGGISLQGIPTEELARRERRRCLRGTGGRLRRQLRTLYARDATARRLGVEHTVEVRPDRRFISVYRFPESTRGDSPPEPGLYSLAIQGPARLSWCQPISQLPKGGAADGH